MGWVGFGSGSALVAPGYRSAGWGGVRADRRRRVAGGCAPSVVALGVPAPRRAFSDADTPRPSVRARIGAGRARGWRPGSVKGLGRGARSATQYGAAATARDAPPQPPGAPAPGPPPHGATRRRPRPHPTTLAPWADLLFLAGLGRSGTTALVEVLAAHPRVVLGVERYKRLYPREEPVTRELFTRERFFALDDGMTNVVPANGEEWQVHYDAMAAKWDTAAYVGDKMVSIRMQHVWETLPEARFVCIVRDIEPVAASWEARARDPEDRRLATPTRTRARRWSAGTARCAGFAARSGSGPTTRSWWSTTASSATRPAPASARCSRGWGSTASPEIDAAFAQVHCDVRREGGAQAAHPLARDAGVPRRARRT